VDLRAWPALQRPGGETPDIGADIQDHRRFVLVGNVILAAQNLLDVTQHCWRTLDIHRARPA
jgi:hypothetical protein